MKSKKTWLILSLVCILSGMLLTAAGTLLGGIPGFYLDKIGVHTSREHAENSAKVSQDTLELEAFDRMELDISYADVTLVPSDRYAVDYRIAGAEPVCSVKDGRLTFCEGISYSEPRIWFLYAGPHYENVREPDPYYVTIEYPADRIFSDITVRMESGDLILPDLQADTLDIRDEYGDVTLNGYTGQELLIRMSSGNLSLGTLQAEQTEIQNDYGEVSLNESVGSSLIVRLSSGGLSLGALQTGRAEIYAEYGDVNIRQAAGDSLHAEFDSGSLLADRLDFTDIKVSSEYGNVCMGVADDMTSYDCRLRTEYGYIRMDGRSLKGSDDEDEVSYTSRGNGERTVEISCENGDIVIDSAP